ASVTNPANAFYIRTDGSVYENVGQGSNAGLHQIFGASSSLQAVQLSAGQDSNFHDALFIRFNNGSVWEYTPDQWVGSGWFWTHWSEVVAGGAADISANPYGFDGADSVFIAGTDGSVTEHSGRDMNSGWTTILSAGAGAAEVSAGCAFSPGYGSNGPTDFHTVYIRLQNGSVWEHVGDGRWYLEACGGVTQISASQARPDDVFEVFGDGSAREVYLHGASQQNNLIAT